MKNIVYFILLLSMTYGQARIGEWESYTSTLKINGIVEQEDLLICATDGGVLLFDQISQNFAELNNIDGLISTKLNCIELGNIGQVWIGGGEPNGFVQLYDYLDQKSITGFDYEMSEIIDFAVSDSIVYAIYRENNDYGIIEIILLNGEFIHKDLYPNWPNGKKIYEIETDGKRVFVATEIGLFIGELGTDPNSWEIPVRDMENEIQSLIINDNILYYFSNNTLFSFELSSLVNSELIAVYANIIDITVLSNGNIFLISNENIFRYNSVEIDNIPIQRKKLNALESLKNSLIAVATNTGLSFINEFNYIEYFIPNSPHQNNFQAITVLSDGRFVGGGGNGIAIKELTSWRNIVESNNEVVIQNNKDYNYFIADSIPVDFGASISKMVQGPDGLLYCAIEGTYPRLNGGGILIIDIDDPTNFTIIDTTFLDYFADEYLVVKDINFDRIGNLWIADPFATNKHEPIHVKSPSGIWKSYKAEDSMGAIGLTPSTIAIDAWQRIWVGSFQDGERNIGFTDGGLAMLSYSGDPLQPDDFQWNNINLTNINSNKTIWSLAVTEENRLYILTPVGLTFFDLQFTNDNPFKYESPRYYFPNISFGQESEIRLDAQGNAWTVSGSDGIHVLLNNSTFWPNEKENIEVESIDLENYPILSNNVTDIAFDNEKGIAYISTNRGINSFRIPFANSQESYSELRVFPSPYHVPSNKPLVIDNIIDNSSVKIMTVAGKVIRSLKSDDLGINGYQIEWDGRDKDGEWVNSGVYLISVYAKNGSHSIEKIVIIRH